MASPRCDGTPSTTYAKLVFLGSSICSSVLPLPNSASIPTTQQNAEVKSIINKDRQLAPKQMPLGVRLAMSTHNMGGRSVDDDDCFYYYK